MNFSLWIWNAKYQAHRAARTYLESEAELDLYKAAELRAEALSSEQQAQQLVDKIYQDSDIRPGPVSLEVDAEIARIRKSQP